MDKQELLRHLQKEGFSKRVVQAFDRVKREDFVPEGYERYAYEDAALPIGYGPTISQPSTIAFMLDLLDPQDEQKILEIGCGCGYVLALLSVLCPHARIYGTERIKNLAQGAKKRLKKYKNVKVYHTPEGVGTPKKKPFDRILVSASAYNIPYYLVEQLRDRGIVVCPVRKSIMKFQRKGDKVEKEDHYGFSFVPLIE